MPPPPPPSQMRVYTELASPLRNQRSRSAHPSKAKSFCLNPACPKSQDCKHGHPDHRAATINKLLHPMELLNRPPNKMEILKLEKEMRGVLADLKEHDRLEEEVKREVRALYQGVKDIENKKPNLDDPLKSCGSAARNLCEAICKKLLHWNALPPGEHDSLETLIFDLGKIDFGEAPEKERVPELMGVLHVLRSYGNVFAHNNAKAPPMPNSKFDTLLIVTAYAYQACQHFLVLLHL
ncbi:hypothetical protein DUNSADRAFT_732 [Dunaliella salina]|uniref:Uncharacterized protein n=1 Tax=Dunaliella salina TaxID=3046 RepID=A0ABQ7GXW6_DUNSA|nr:hypothetical protein DUNSADRAFT_732 [Dunaliella salina]|eukprot:KAF5839447.1 hypothetical protein DUNSADRAFT_732 [Dunaliella salina]